MRVGEKNKYCHIHHGQGLWSKDHTVLQQGFVRVDPASGQRAVLDVSPVAIFCKRLY